MIVTAPHADDGGTQNGCVFVLFLRISGQVLSHQRISNTQGEFTGLFSDTALVGWDSSLLGDLDSDSYSDLVLSAPGDDAEAGAVYVIFLSPDGTCVSHQKLDSSGSGGFTAGLGAGIEWGYAVGALGDLNGDEVR